jgi:IS5 family transposase
LSQKAVGSSQDTPVKRGDGGYADWVIVGLQCLRKYLNHTYRQLIDVLQEMPAILDTFGLTPATLPDFTTVCARKQALEMRVWRVLLRLSVSVHNLGDIQAIDATGFDRRAVSRRYGNRIDYHFQAVKTTALVDCETNVIIDIHCSMKQPHDSQIGWQVLTRNLDRLQIITADKGYDWDDLRGKLRDHDIRPVIKHKEHWNLDKAHNARMDDDVYHQRSNVESVFFTLKHRFGDTLRARTWFGQFRELVLIAAVRNIQLDVRA